MKYDVTKLTFLPDPLIYQPGPDEVCAFVPAHVASEEELIAILKDQLGLPWYCGLGWSSLHEVLRHWSDWQTTPMRATIIHHDLPLVHESTNGWLGLKNYIEVLIDSMQYLQAAYAQVTEESERHELVPIFPSYTQNEIHAVLTHPPVWQFNVGFLKEEDLSRTFDPTWEQVHEFLKALDGLTCEVCLLFREDVGWMKVQYIKPMNAYLLDYDSADRKRTVVASAQESVHLPPVVSLIQATRLLKTFFTTGQLSGEVHWVVLSGEDARTLIRMRKEWYYRTDNERLLEINLDIPRSTIQQGVFELAPHTDGNPFSLAYWQALLTQQEVVLPLRLAAMCVIGLSDLPDALTLLHPFLGSPIKQERWVSVRFLAPSQHAGVLSILLSMLTDEMPFTMTKAADEYGWYDRWRDYAPHLLRAWPQEEITEQMQQALALWVRSEPLLDTEFDVVESYEKTLCYELGYRGVQSPLQDLPLEGKHLQELKKAFEQGETVRKKKMTVREEYVYRRNGGRSI